ncbi:MAG: hypothetical protein C3F11_15635 [Methylocystaceae bacterium]|nr:MAG: hypothetical protein C3F11_15635 [Methylocystaceae bacterium]
MKAIRRTVLTAAASLLPATAMAHPGSHPEDLSWSLLHAFTQPDHLLTMALVVVWAAMVAGVAYWFKPWRVDSWSR